MAKIARSEYQVIHDKVKVDGRKVPDVASEYGCSANNIYHICGVIAKAAAAAGLHGVAPEAQVAGSPVPPEEEAALPAPAGISVSAAIFTAEPSSAVEVSAVPEPFAELGGEAPTPRELCAETGSQAAEEITGPQIVAAAVKLTPAPVRRREEPVEAPAYTGRPRGGAAPKVSQKLGFGLVMRSPEGDEETSPFRSIDDLLSAIKPILRGAARNPEPVWFSIQPIDLSQIDISEVG